MKTKSNVRGRQRGRQPFDRAFENILRQTPEHIVFWDEDGILEGGLWVLFDQTDCDRGYVLKVLHNREFGDIILLCSSYDEIEDNEIDLETMIGFATVAQYEPESIVDYINDYWSCIKRKLSKVSNNHRYVYEYILDKLDDCNLLIAEGITMQKNGLKIC